MGRRDRQPGAVQALAIITPGLEDALLAELAEHGVRGEAIRGGALFQADHETLYALHLWARTPARIVVRVGTVPARHLEQLGNRVRSLDWRPWIWPHQPLEVKASASKSHLKHRDSIAKKVEVGIADALRGPRVPGRRSPHVPTRVQVRIEHDEATLSVDASGELLHKRGWRRDVAKAPLRENLAAAVLRLAEWAPGEPLVDPMCGSGTFAIEAAAVSLHHAPGYHRSFAFQRWPSYDERLFKRLRREAQRLDPLDKHTEILAADRDRDAVRAAKANADRANVDRRINVTNTPLSDLDPPRQPGLIVMNPPYGERIGGRPGHLFRTIGRLLRARWEGWRVAILLPGARHLAALDLAVEPVAEFSNGGIDVVLAVGRVGRDAPPL